MLVSEMTLECWNRCGTYMFNRLDEGARMWSQTGVSNGGIMADTFHMNIEEGSVPGAIRTFGALSTSHLLLIRARGHYQTSAPHPP